MAISRLSFFVGYQRALVIADKTTAGGDTSIVTTVDGPTLNYTQTPPTMKHEVTK